MTFLWGLGSSSLVRGPGHLLGAPNTEQSEQRARGLELETKLREDFTITDNAQGAFSTVESLLVLSHLRQFHIYLLSLLKLSLFILVDIQELQLLTMLPFSIVS